jgi:hypothetical protein
MNRETARFETMLQEHLDRIKQEKLEAVGGGVDTEMYRYWTGYIRCLKDVSDIIVAVHKKFDQE